MQFSTEVKITDRGLAYGDGFFTTAKIIEGHVEHWKLHVERLNECALRLGFPALDIEVLSCKVSEVTAGCLLGTLKIIITRGCGGRGYEPPTMPVLTASIQVLPFPTHYPALLNHGLQLGISAIRLASQPLLAGLKTLNRLEQVLIKQELAALAYDDVLVMDYEDKIIETSVGNLLLYKDKQWFTPNLNTCGIQGVQLKTIQQRLTVKSCDLYLDDVINSDGLFVCNSLMGVIPVTSVIEKTWSLEASHELAKREGLYG